MSLSLISAFLDWISQHSFWSGMIIFLIACSESLALVGLIVPGAVLMFALGTLITTGHLEFWPAVSWAVAGAIAGDGISYWLGYRYHEQLMKLWPLSRHPELLDKGKSFFDRHGGKSVLFGRFVGPLRPIVPAIAGMTGMSLIRFLIINVLSGIAWAPLYLLPGMAFGLSLTLAGEVAGRLVVAILLIMVLMLLLLWLGKRIYGLMLPRVDQLLFGITRWSRKHPLAGQIPEALIQPNHPEVRVLSLLALLLFLASSFYLALLHWSGQASLLAQLDKLLRFNLEVLRSPWFDQLMLYLSSWLSLQGILLVSLLTAIWLVWQRRLFTLWHLLAALGLPLLMGYGLPLLFGPTEVELPAPTILVASSVYGFITVALVRELRQRYHLAVYLCLTSLLFLTGFAQLYLQFYSLSAIASGLSLGIIWFTLVGIAYRRHVHQAFVKTSSLLGLGLLNLFCLLLIIPNLASQQLPESKSLSMNITLSDWQTKGWQSLPTVRQDVRYQRNHPLNLQWAGELGEIQQLLSRSGWQTPVSGSSLNLLQWFNPNPKDQDLPLLPQVHDGHYDVARWIRFEGDGPIYLRLWQSNTRLMRQGKLVPLWTGSIGRLYRQQIMGLTLFRTATDYRTIPGVFTRGLKSAAPQLKVQTESLPLNGSSVPVLLLYSAD